MKVRQIEFDVIATKDSGIKLADAFVVRPEEGWRSRKRFAICPVDLTVLSESGWRGGGQWPGGGKTERGESDRIDVTGPRKSLFFLVPLEGESQRGAFFSIGVFVKEVAFAKLLLDSANLFIGKNFIGQQ